MFYEKKLIDNIEAVFRKHMHQMHSKTKAHMLYNIICIDEKCLFKGKVHDIFVEKVLSGKFADIFKSWRIFQAIDSTREGIVNYSGIHSLRDALREDNPIEKSNTITDKNRNKRKRRRVFLLPSSYKIKKCVKDLEEYAKKII